MPSQGQVHEDLEKILARTHKQKRRRRLVWSLAAAALVLLFLRLSAPPAPDVQLYIKMSGAPEASAWQLSYRAIEDDR